MTNHPTLFMLVLGCKPNGRHTEQHDVFFCIENRFNNLSEHIYKFWPDGGRIHVDAWRKVCFVNGYRIRVVSRESRKPSKHNLYFLNLGGYQPGNMDELHHKMLVVGTSKADALKQAKNSAFFKSMSFQHARSHVDDQYGVDVDDLYRVEDILPAEMKSIFALDIFPEPREPDELHIGYTKLPSKPKKNETALLQHRKSE
jgi:hypothetical protein